MYNSGSEASRSGLPVYVFLLFSSKKDLNTHRAQRKNAVILSNYKHVGTNINAHVTSGNIMRSFLASEQKNVASNLSLNKFAPVVLEGEEKV